ncbi:hypothetical protein [Parasediminibacterium sp. JCM 36343]|uniref:hypothetical protein n=1 Tax=Parasediminibacterium sp. JCM 36343 TaxID=3374279 RepID=UPI00397D60E9
MKISLLLLVGLLITTSTVFASNGFADAADFGFLPNETGVHNTKALQTAVDKGGTIIISKIGTYKVAGTVYIGDNTSLVFGDGTSVEKSAENGKFGYVLLNKGALSKTYNYHISITGLTLKVNGVDTWMGEIYGDRGQISFIWVKDLKIERFRCTDLASGQFCIQVCTFEDFLINDVIIIGKKDAIHLGRGKRFRISNCVFQTADDAIALAAGDWISGNPELGDIEDGVIENCYDLKAEKLEGAFAKIVPAAWVDWKPGIKVRHGDAVVCNGRIYRVLAVMDGKSYESINPPTFSQGSMEIDGIKWMLHQTDTFHTASVKNITFRDIFLESVRVPFQLMSYANNYSHSYYNGAPVPVLSGISLENIRVISTNKKALVGISAPCDFIAIRNSSLQGNGVEFTRASDFDAYPKTTISFANCVFNSAGSLGLVNNYCKGIPKEIAVKTTGSIELGDNFSAKVSAGEGIISVESDLTGLKK